MKKFFGKIFREYKWFFVISTLVNFLTSSVYYKLYPIDSGYSFQGIIATLVPGLIVAVIFNRRIKRKITENS